MISKILKHRSFRIFLFSFFSLLIITGTLTTATHLKETAKEKKSYMLNLTKETNRVINYFNQNFTAIINTCNSISTSQWYKHYRNIANIYNDEFDILRRMEIISDIQSKVTALPYVSNILVIVPSSDNIIDKNGWFPIDNYLNIYDLINIDGPDSFAEPPIITAANNSICVITLEDSIVRRNKGVISVIIDKKSFSCVLKSILPDNAIYIYAEINGQILYESGDLTENLIINNSSINTPQFSITIGYLNYEETTMAAARITNYILIQIIVLISSIIVSTVITSLTLRPLNQIVRRFGGRAHLLEDPYSFVSEYIETFSYRNAQLRIEKDNLNKSMDRFISLMNKEILFSMITNPKFDFGDETILSSISWINNGCPFVLVLIEPKIQESTNTPNYATFDSLSVYAFHYYSFEIFPNNLCLLFSFNDTESAKGCYEELSTQIKHHSNPLYYYSISNILQKPQDMRVAYLSLKTKIADQKHIHIDLPISMEIKLINKLQKNKYNDFVTILRKAKPKHNPDAFIWLLVRVAAEYGVDSTHIVKLYFQHSKNHSLNKQWDVIIRFANELCESINNYKHTTMYESSEIIRQYIDKNYFDPDISVNQLAEHFSMHRSLISKILKSQLGITFSDYLLELRIKNAMNLLKNTDDSITKVGKMVGYVNYNTFKRAFIRYKGISPRKFREQLDRCL